MDFTSSQFWIALLQIIAIDVLLGGDNAVVIALACRRLSPSLRNKGIFWGVFGAIALRVLLIFFAITLLKIPYLKSVGAVLLVWIGVKLLLPEKEGGHEISASDHLLGAIKTIVIADAVMSLDNVIAIAGAAKDSMVLIVFGLLVSVPIIVWGSKIVLTLMERYPLIITAGGALLGWIAGGMFASDVAVKDWVAANAPWLSQAAPVAGALLVIVLGRLMGGRTVRRTAAKPPVDLATGEQATPPTHRH
jgi:YjbE family integral membrane protein